VYRCGCVDPVTGRHLGQQCSRLAGGRHGSWYLRLDLPVGPDGRRRRIRRGGYASRRAAAAALAAIRGPDPAEPFRAITTGEWLEHWLASRTSPAASTVRSYAGHVRLYLKPYLGQVLLAELSAAHVQAMFTAITRHQNAAGSPVSAATLSRIRATLRAALNTAMRSGLICDNPHACGEALHRRPCPPDCPKARRAAGRKHICSRPCPPGCTAPGGKCPHFCASDCTSHAASCPQRQGGWMFVRPKGKRKRAVPIPPGLIEPLREHLAGQDTERHAEGDSWEDWDLVWCGPQGQPIDPHDDWEEWKALLAEARIAKDARLHDARHTAGTLLGEQHVDMHVIQRILGHAQVTTTRIYTEPTDPLTREAAGLIGKALWPDAGRPQPQLQPEAGS